MATSSELKSRMSSISETKKVTNAMYMISSVKMRRAKCDMLETHPYFTALKKEITELLRYIPETQNRYFRTKQKTDDIRHGLLLVTSDKGLAGGYNQNAISMAEDFARQNPGTTFFIVGEYGRQHFASKNIPYDADFEFSAATATMWQARRICLYILEYFNTGKLDDISIIYSDPEAGNGSECQLQCLLPLERSSFCPEEGVSEQATKDDWNAKEFYPDPNTVLDCVVPSYLAGYIYSSLIDSYFDEQEARMSAMSVAGKNAEDMIKQLKIEYNRVRQAKITREMVEIASGARALKNKRQKMQSEGHRLEQSNQ